MVMIILSIVLSVFSCAFFIAASIRFKKKVAEEEQQMAELRATRRAQARGREIALLEASIRKEKRRCEAFTEHFAFRTLASPPPPPSSPRPTVLAAGSKTRSSKTIVEEEEAAEEEETGIGRSPHEKITAASSSCDDDGDEEQGHHPPSVVSTSDDSDEEIMPSTTKDYLDRADEEDDPEKEEVLSKQQSKDDDESSWGHGECLPSLVSNPAPKMQLALSPPSLLSESVDGRDGYCTVVTTVRDSSSSHPIKNYPSEEDCCCICLEPYQPGDVVCWGEQKDLSPDDPNRCHHMFHKDCALQWFLRSSDHNQCPMCRNVLLPPGEDKRIIITPPRVPDERHGGTSQQQEPHEEETIRNDTDDHITVVDIEAQR